jgi:hypothetical protein
MAYLAMQVRTGKTLTALEACRLYGAKRVLFLTKKKAILSIINDYNNFGYTFGLTVKNYEQLGKFPFAYDVAVCDEAHGLGAYPKPSLRARLLKRCVGTTPVVYLSGTPTPESYSQIYHQLWISARSPYARYRNFYAWARDYVVVKQERRGAYLINNYDAADEARIRRDLAPIMLTYTQEQSGFDCPVEEHIHEILDTRIPELIRRIYRDRILRMCCGDIVADTPAALMGKMHQISSGTVIGSEYTAIFSDAKARYIRAKFCGKRIAIFYKFAAERTVILSIFPQATESPEAFQRGESDIFISQIQSGREGITLSTADAIVMYGIDYSAVSYWQARARLQALDRTSPAEVHWIFALGGIERRVHEAVKSKHDFTYSYFRRSGGI